METNNLTNMELTEKERQAIYDVIAYEERKHDIFDPKHVERMARTIQEKLAEIRKNEDTSEELIEQIHGIISSKKWMSLYHHEYMLYERDFKSVAAEIANIPQIRANSSKICKVNEELLDALMSLYESLPDGYTHESVLKAKAILHPIYAERNHSRCNDIKNDEF